MTYTIIPYTIRNKLFFSQQQIYLSSFSMFIYAFLSNLTNKYNLNPLNLNHEEESKITMDERTKGKRMG